MSNLRVRRKFDAEIASRTRFRHKNCNRKGQIGGYAKIDGCDVDFCRNRRFASFQKWPFWLQFLWPIRAWGANRSPNLHPTRANSVQKLHGNGYFWALVALGVSRTDRDKNQGSVGVNFKIYSLTDDSLLFIVMAVADFTSTTPENPLWQGFFPSAANTTRRWRRNRHRRIQLTDDDKPFVARVCRR